MINRLINNNYVVLITLLIIIVILHNYYPIPFNYPTTNKNDKTFDVYHSIKIFDPYRWLEDDKSLQTEAWVDKQNSYTNRYLQKIPFLEKVEKRLTQLWDHPIQSMPFIKGDKTYFYKNTGLQNQSVLYVKKRFFDHDSTAEIVIDPNTFSPDGKISLGGLYFSNDFNYLGYSIQQSGSDWREFFIKDLLTGEDIKDHLKWIKFSSMAWSGDGFYYNRPQKPEKGKELTEINQNVKVFYHMLGTKQEEDILIFEDSLNPKISSYPITTSDGKYLFISRSKGTYGNSLMIKNLTEKNSDFLSITNDFGSELKVIDNVNDKIFALTDRNAPKKRIVLIDPINPSESNWKTIIPEKEQVLTSVDIIHQKIVAHYMVDVYSKWVIYDLAGEFVKEVKLPGPGVSFGFSGTANENISWYSFESLVHPRTIYSFNFEKMESSIYYESESKFKIDDYITKQKFYSSKDGTKIPMFIAHHKDLILDSERPTLLHGYGGFNITKKPYFNKTIPFILENGGVYALANIRGGGEYGQEWHEAGMLLNKQNVFDDFIAGAQFLITEGYTSTNRLAIRGGSNGGTLVGAVINQRPNLFRVAFPEVGVMDMLRYEKFTIGWAWAVEYGSVEDKLDFKNLLSYSPLHNIKKQTYPSVLIYTADHDDRVIPGHSFKYAAQLQNYQQGNDPILIRIGESTGHGSGRATKKRIKEYAEKWAFMFYEMGLDI